MSLIHHVLEKFICRWALLILLPFDSVYYTHIASSQLEVFYVPHYLLKYKLIQSELYYLY